MPLVNPPGAVLLDVRLTRNGQIRRWTIHTGEFPDYWNCRLVEPHCVTVSACFTKEDLANRVADWEAQIETAKRDGWS